MSCDSDTDSMQRESRVLDFHLSNLEFACGASLDKVRVCRAHQRVLSQHPPLQVSSFNWDHNDNFPQFSGCHALLPEGYMSVLSRLAEGFEVQLDSVVKHVELLRREGSNYTFIRVTDTRGNEFTGDKVRCGSALRLHAMTCL